MKILTAGTRFGQSRRQDLSKSHFTTVFSAEGAGIHE